MRLSIIIPMYNVELYIKKCLQSCINQDISSNDYEIIIVNDGSQDDSLKIAESIAVKVNNIRIISQQNKGLSIARNTGLKHSTGNYVWFVDSDDCVRENCLRRLLDQCEHDKLDILAVCAANVIDGIEKKRFSYTFNGVMLGGEAIDKGGMQYCVPFSIYRREFLIQHELSFYPGIFHEDSEFSPRSYYYAQRVGFSNEIVYLVTINPNSITRTINYMRALDYLKVAISIHDFYRINTMKDIHSAFFHNHVSLMINNAMAILVNPKGNCTTRMNVVYSFTNALYEYRYLFQHLLHSSIFKYKIEGLLFVLFPRKAINIYSMLQYFKKTCSKIFLL